MSQVICEALIHEKCLLVVEVLLCADVELVLFHNKLDYIFLQALLPADLLGNFCCQAVLLILCLSYG